MILSERKERVLHLNLNIPPVNVIDTAACNALAEALKEAAADETIAALLLSGEGKCFSAGASVEEHEEQPAQEMIPAFAAACKALFDMPAPTVALVHGFCFGGGLELALYADYIVADPTASFAVPEIKLAFFPPLACSALPGIIGRQNAAHMIFTGSTLDAERAHTVGLVQEILEQAKWDDITRRFNNTSAPVLRLAKEAFRAGLNTPVEEIDGPITKDLFLKRLYEIEDVSEGIASFAEKRKPQWQHK